MKSNKIAENYREKAKEFRTAGKHTEALKAINQSLRFASCDFVESSDILKTRDEILTKFGITRVEPATTIQSPCSSGSYVDRASSSSCEQDKWNFFKLSQPASERIPFIADCLEVKENDVYGRFIATTKDLQPGDIVIIEEPFYKVIGSSERNQRCAVCLKQNMLNLTPCSKCATGK